MKNLLISGLLAALLLSVSLHLRGGQGEEGAKLPRRRMVHSVYFELKDDSAEARQRFTVQALKHLAGHPGVERFWAGERAEGLGGKYAQDFDVALHQPCSVACRAWPPKGPFRRLPQTNLLRSRRAARARQGVGLGTVHPDRESDRADIPSQEERADRGTLG